MAWSPVTWRNFCSISVAGAGVTAWACKGGRSAGHDLSLSYPVLGVQLASTAGAGGDGGGEGPPQPGPRRAPGLEESVGRGEGEGGEGEGGHAPAQAQHPGGVGVLALVVGGWSGGVRVE